jgi:hypothetical protein
MRRILIPVSIVGETPNGAGWAPTLGQVLSARAMSNAE